MAEKQASSVTVCAFALKTLILIIMALQNLIPVTFWVKNEVFFRISQIIQNNKGCLTYFSAVVKQFQCKFTIKCKLETENVCL